jgi:hypothetical protein
MRDGVEERKCCAIVRLDAHHLKIRFAVDREFANRTAGQVLSESCLKKTDDNRPKNDTK